MMALGKEKNVQSQEKSSGENIKNRNGLVLYSFHHCFHSQKVLMTLYEKKIPFTIESVDTTSDEQYKSWFLKINPTGTLPVLKDGIKYIPYSNDIMGYLEDNFSNGEYTRLTPTDLGLDVKQRVISYHDRISKISPYVLTMGTVINNRWCTKLRYPYSLSYVRKSIKASLFASGKNLRKYASKNVEFHDVLLQKADLEEKKLEVIKNAENYTKIIEVLEDLLGEIEKIFYDRGPDKSHWWLCCDRFTIADVSLAVLLERISRLGMEQNFWTGGMRPHVEMYFQRVQQRDSYKKTMPTPMTDLHFIMSTRGSFIIGVSLLTALSIGVGGFFLIKRYH